MSDRGQRVWLVRIAVLAALAATVVLAGPRAWHVLAYQVRGGGVDSGAPVEVERVGFRQTPAWLRGDLLVAVLRDVQPRLGGELGLLDAAAATALQERLAGSPWVAGVQLERAFPDRYLASLELRRPVLQLFDRTGQLCALADRDGMTLPAVAGTDLPRADLHGASLAPRPGFAHPDARARAAARVAVEWAEQLAPLLPAAPRLALVDSSNLGYRFIGDGRWAEVRVGLARGDGEVVWFAYGHPPGSAAPRVAVETKAGILRSVLAEFPELAGLQGGDLRFVNRWRNWLIPRPPAAEPR